ncbi:MAG: hypothetical protein ACFB10_03260 [Salibacteraceae bacterium]
MKSHNLLFSLFFLLLLSACSLPEGSSHESSKAENFAGLAWLEALPLLPKYGEPVDATGDLLTQAQAQQIFSEATVASWESDGFPKLRLTYKVKFPDGLEAVIYQYDERQWHLCAVGEDGRLMERGTLLYDEFVWAKSAVFSGQYFDEDETVLWMLLGNDGEEIVDLLDEYIATSKPGGKFGPLLLEALKAKDAAGIIAETPKHFLLLKDYSINDLLTKIGLDFNATDLSIAEAHRITWFIGEEQTAEVVIAMKEAQTEPRLMVVQADAYGLRLTNVAVQEFSPIRQYANGTFEWTQMETTEEGFYLRGTVSGQAEAEGGDGFRFYNEEIQAKITANATATEFYLVPSDGLASDTLHIDEYDIVVFQPSEDEWEMLATGGEGVYEAASDFGYYLNDFLSRPSMANLKLQSTSARILTYSSDGGEELQHFDRFDTSKEPFGVIFNKKGCPPKIVTGVLLDTEWKQEYEAYLAGCE